MKIAETHLPARTSLSILVPVYNEQENLRPLVDSIFDVLGSDPNFMELLLIDDGSLDGTAELAASLAQQDGRIRLISHAQNRGLGAAIRTGLAEAKGDLILYTDADLPFDFKIIPQLLQHSSPQQVIVGCRTNRDEGFRRWMLSKGYNVLCNSLFDLSLSDINFACKILPRSALAKMRLESEGSFIDAELLLECRRNGLGISEFPLIYYPRTRGLSTLSRPRVVLGILAEMFRYSVRPARAGNAPTAAVPSRQQRYGAAAVVFSIAVLLIALLHPVSTIALFAIFLPAVLAITWYSGTGPGLIATAVAALCTDYLQLAPLASLKIASPRHVVQVATFVTIPLLFTAVTSVQKWGKSARRRKQFMCPKD